jgi:ParB family chromosome partitioning protein
MPNKNKPAPKLDNLDALFADNGGVNPIEKAEPQQIRKQGITHAAIKQLVPFKAYPFRPYEGERLDDMVASIKKNNVIVPIIVRRLADTLEILSGHNRVNAAKLAGLDKVPALVLDDVSDEDAMAYVVETNLVQRSFSDMCHSEKAAVLALHHSKMFSQGKRNDILKQTKMLENPHEYKDSGTFRQIGEKSRSDKSLAEMYSLSARTVSRYLRIQLLIPQLKSLLDNGNIPLIPAVTLSSACEAA